MSAPTEHEIAREARRILRKLAEPRSRLAPNGDGGWHVLNHCDALSGKTRTSGDAVAEFRKRGWIAPLPGSAAMMVLTRQGRALADQASATSDFGDEHRLLALRHIRDDSGEEVAVAINEAESPLVWLSRRGAVDTRQLEAGERLRRDYTIAQLEPRLCCDLFAPVVAGGRGQHNACLSETAIAAKQRFSRAMSAVGPGLSDLLFDVCCALKRLGAVEAANAWPQRSGKVVLALALDRLAAHYGIRDGEPRGRLRHWSRDSEPVTEGGLVAG